MEHLQAWLNIPSDYYLMGSLLLSLMMLLHYLSVPSKMGKAEWVVVLTCLPVINLLMGAYLLLEGVTKLTGKEIVIGRGK
jgi:hypothetical protein